MKTRYATSNARRTLLHRGRDLLQSVSPANRRKARNTDVMELLNDEQREELAEIHLALERIERGIFGFCLECKQRICEEQLSEAPWEPRCVECEQADSGVHEVAGQVQLSA